MQQSENHDIPDRIEKLIEQFGSTLEGLTNLERQQLRLALCFYLLSIGDDSSSFTMAAALVCASHAIFEPSPNLQVACGILEGVTHKQAENLIEAITAQLKGF